MRWGTRSSNDRPYARTRRAEDATIPDVGPLFVTVPGAARGWERIVAEFGRKPFDRVLESSIEYAVNGYPVTEQIAAEWRLAADRLVDDVARETFLFDGDPPEVGRP
ncbi:hypothetical protein JCM31271_34630 [Halorubrum trueperi]